MKKDLLHDLIIRGQFSKTEPVNQTTRRAYQIFGSTFNGIGRVALKLRSNSYKANNHKLFLTERTERKLLVNDILQT